MPAGAVTRRSRASRGGPDVLQDPQPLASRGGPDKTAAAARQPLASSGGLTVTGSAGGSLRLTSCS